MERVPISNRAYPLKHLQRGFIPTQSTRQESVLVFLMLWHLFWCILERKHHSCLIENLNALTFHQLNNTFPKKKRNESFRAEPFLNLNLFEKKKSRLGINDFEDLGFHQKHIQYKCGNGKQEKSQILPLKCNMSTFYHSKHCGT